MARRKRSKGMGIDRFHAADPTQVSVASGQKFRDGLRGGRNKTRGRGRRR